MGINTHALTLNKNPITIKKIVGINTHTLILNKNFFIGINTYK